MGDLVEQRTNRFEQFHRAGQAAIDVIASRQVGLRWNDRSVLVGYPVGGLAAHLGRALTTVEIYLDAAPPGVDAAVADAPTYFALALADHDPVDSEFHAKVRERGNTAAAAGQAALVVELRDVHTRLAARRLDPDRQIAVLGGTVMSLSAYLETRLVELVIHTVDLADSVGLPIPSIDETVWESVAHTVTETALRRNDAMSVALGLARPDRYSPIRAF
jgi:hypothetical protein